MLRTMTIALVLLGGCENKLSGERKPDLAPSPPTPAPLPAVPPIDVTAKQLFADYEANEVSADDKYKGKVLRVSGTISKIGKDVLGDPFVEFDVGDAVFDVQCMFDDSVGLAELKRRQTATVRCKDPGKLGNVILRSCVIVPAPPAASAPPLKRRAEPPTQENREQFALKLKGAVGDKADFEADGLTLILSTTGGRNCVELKYVVLEQAERLRALGFKGLKCEGDSIVSVIQ